MENQKNNVIQIDPQVVVQPDVTHEAFTGLQTQAQAGDAFLARAEKIRESGLRGWIPSGFSQIDASLNLLTCGDFTVVGGRPGIGKTIVGDQLATAATAFGNVLFFTLEMPPEKLFQRKLAAKTGLSVTQIVRADELGNEDFARIRLAAQEIKTSSENGLFYALDRDIAAIEDRGTATMKQFDGTRKPLSLIVIDYLQLVENAGCSGSRLDVVSGVSRRLAELAKKLRIPVVALAQLNRGSDSRPDSTPQLNDLRESGSIEQDAATVLLIHRVKKDGVASDEARFLLPKVRDGAIGEFQMKFNPTKMKFEDPGWTRYGADKKDDDLHEQWLKNVQASKKGTGEEVFDGIPF